MRRSRFSEEQIIGILKEHRAGLGVAELYRTYGGSGVAELYRTYGGRSEHNQTPLTCT